MKNGKNPTRNQRKIMEKMELNTNDWLVEKDTPIMITFIHRQTKEKVEVEK